MRASPLLTQLISLGLLSASPLAAEEAAVSLDAAKEQGRIRSRFLKQAVLNNGGPEVALEANAEVGAL